MLCGEAICYDQQDTGVAVSRSSIVRIELSFPKPFNWYTTALTAALVLLKWQVRATVQRNESTRLWPVGSAQARVGSLSDADARQIVLRPLLSLSIAQCRADSHNN